MAENKSIEEIKEDTNDFMKRASYCYPELKQINVDEFVFVFARIALTEEYMEDKKNEEEHHAILENLITTVLTK